MDRSSTSPGRHILRLWERAVLAAWWSLPLGLVEGLRVGVTGYRLQSFYEGELRLATAIVTLTLFYAFLFVLIALLAGAMARVLEKWSPMRWDQMQDLGVALALQGCLLLMVRQADHSALSLGPGLACGLAWLALWFFWGTGKGPLEGRRARALLALACGSSAAAFFSTYLNSWDKRPVDFHPSSWAWALTALAAMAATYLVPARRAAATTGFFFSSLASFCWRRRSAPGLLQPRGRNIPCPYFF